MHPLFDETALERVRIPGCFLGAEADTEASLRVYWSARSARSATGSAAGSNRSSVRLWLGPLCQFPAAAAANLWTKEAQLAWKRHASFRVLRGRLHNHLLSGTSAGLY